MALYRRRVLNTTLEEACLKDSSTNIHIARPVQEYIGVLVVDDDEAIRATVRFILETECYRVDEAANGQIALTMLRTAARPHVVLLDLIMPQLDGASVLRSVAAERSLAERHTFLLFTATPDSVQEQLGDVLEDLSIPLVRKPFDIDDLLAAVEEAGQRLLRQMTRSKTAPGFFSSTGSLRRLG